MAQYIVRETYTLMHRIEANSEAEALDLMKDRSPRDFDEIDQCAPMPEATVELDPEA